MTTSSTWSPASAAGEGSSPSVGATAPTTTSSVFGSPYVTNSVKYRTAATRTCDSGPARITSERCQIGFALYERATSSGATDSYGFIPAIFT